jgi:hypothetical protein
MNFGVVLPYYCIPEPEFDSASDSDSDTIYEYYFQEPSENSIQKIFKKIKNFFKKF